MNLCQQSGLSNLSIRNGHGILIYLALQRVNCTAAGQVYVADALCYDVVMSLFLFSVLVVFFIAGC